MRLRVTYFVLALMSLAADGIVSGSVALADNQKDDELLSIQTPGGETIHAELADTPQKRARGLMFRESLSKDRGMLFTFAEAQPWSFWMKNTKLALDIIWLDEKKKIVHIERNVPTCSRADDSCPQYRSNDNAMYVLELGGGTADAYKLQRGAKLQFTLPSGPPR